MRTLDVQGVSERVEARTGTVGVRSLVSFPVVLGTLLVALVILVVGQLLRSPGHASRDLVAPAIDVFEGDTWFHILVGEDILRTHSFPTADSYSFTVSGNELIAHEWLGQVLMAAADRLGGLRALTILFFVATAALTLLLFYYSSLRSGNPKAAFLACVAALTLLCAAFTLRPQLFGYIFLFLTMILMEHFRRGRNWVLWLLPPLFVLWVNTHGSFMLGLFLLVVHWATGLARFQAGRVEAEPWTPRQRLHLEVVMLLCALGLFVTPYGSRLFGYALHMLLAAPLQMSSIQEYLPLSGERLTILVVLLLTFLAAQAVLRPKYRLDDFGLLLITLYGAFVHERLLLFCIPVFTPLLAMLLSRWIPNYEAAKDKYLLNAVLIVLVMFVAMVKFFPSQHDLERAVASAFPRGATEYLQRHPIEGRMYNHDFWGAYLIRSLGRDHKVFVDGNAQRFEDAGVYEDYLRINRVDPETPLLLRKYALDACLTHRWGALATYLSESPYWELVYQDNLAALFVRKTPVNN